MIYDTVIIGGGVVGLSILRSSLIAGYNSILIERNPHLCDGASGRNSGVVCTGVDAAPGSLERALIRDSISRVREFCLDHNIPTRECGSLVCLWPWDFEGSECGMCDEKKVDNTVDGMDKSNLDNIKEPFSEDGPQVHEKLSHILHDSLIAGDKDAKYLSAELTLKLEPSLSSKCRGAIHIPGEIVVDPWLFPIAMAAHSRELAAKSATGADDVIQTGMEVVMKLSSFDSDRGLWNVVARGVTESNKDDTFHFTARSIINAAGIDSDVVQLSALSAGGDDQQIRYLLPPPTFEARPRRGQYIIYSAPKEDDSHERKETSKTEWPGVPRTVPIRPIQPVPTVRTKGIFVYSTLYNQIVVGPTAEDQSSRTDDKLDQSVAETLAAHASRVFDRSMGLRSTENYGNYGGSHVVGEYVGIRPGTSKRDYQIHLHYPAKFITVGGIRSTGLTASLGIGRHVVQCLLSSLVTPPDSPYMVLRPTPLPGVKELVDQYHSRNDGTVMIGGHVYKVTHPLTKMGWDARSGLAE